MTEVDYYKILGVSKTATNEQIKARYLSLAKKFHPDRGGDDSLMVLVNEAYKALYVPPVKNNYDVRRSTNNPSSNSRNVSRTKDNTFTQTRTYQYASTKTGPQQQTRPTSLKREKSRKPRMLWWAVPTALALIAIPTIEFFSHNKNLTNLQTNASAINASNGTTGSSSFLNNQFSPPNAQAAAIGSEVVASMNINFAPSSYSVAYTKAFQEYYGYNCMENEQSLNTSFSNYTNSQQVAFCGCSLSVLESTYSYSQALQLQQQVNSGNQATALNSAVNQKCSFVGNS